MLGRQDGFRDPGDRADYAHCRSRRPAYRTVRARAAGTKAAVAGTFRRVRCADGDLMPSDLQIIWRPLEGWPGPMTAQTDRKSGSQFRMARDKTLRLLK